MDINFVFCFLSFPWFYLRGDYSASTDLGFQDCVGKSSGSI